MNKRQAKKKALHEAMPHGGRKKYKKAMRKADLWQCKGRGIWVQKLRDLYRMKLLVNVHLKEQGHGKSNN